MILNPDASLKGPDGLGVLRMNINGQAADVTQVLPAYGFEGVVFPVKVILIHHERFHREFAQAEVLCEHPRGEESWSMEKARRVGIGNERCLNGLIVDLLAELQPAQEVGIFGRHVAQFAIRVVILKVGLDPRREFRQSRTGLPLVGDDVIDHIGELLGFRLRNRLCRL